MKTIDKLNVTLDFGLLQLEVLSTFSSYAKELDINATERNLVTRALNDKCKQF